MNVGILGSGVVGQALGFGFLQARHVVRIGTRDPGKLKDWIAKAGAGASTGTVAETAAFGELIVLATKWDGTEAVIQAADPARLAGKVVIDTTNPLDFSHGAPPRLALGHTDSAGEQVQRWLPKARVVKAFNIVGNAHMVQAQFPGGPPDMFICGNDADAKKTVFDICTTFGFVTTDLGGIENARYLEPMAMVWVAYGFRHNTWNHAFKLLHKSSKE